jgi:hypothetical protein
VGAAARRLGLPLRKLRGSPPLLLFMQTFVRGMLLVTAGSQTRKDTVEPKKQTRTRPDTPHRDEGRSGETRGPQRAPADQLGAILTKGLDLAEASLSLGMTVISRVGAIAQQQVLGKITVPMTAPETGAGAPPNEHGHETDNAAAPETPVPAGSQEPMYCITNRLPLAPGGSVEVSFSINNDSMAAPKPVRLRIEGFTGEAEGGRIEAEGFVVKPPRKKIAPMDFEKFVLSGTVPPDTPPDVYGGWVVVSSGGEFRIPVRLVVLPM